MSNDTIFHLNCLSLDRLCAADRKAIVEVIRKIRTQEALDLDNLIKHASKEVIQFFENISNQTLDDSLLEEREQYLKNKVRIITLLDNDYPEGLLALDEPPVCLFVRSQLQNPIASREKLVSIVGSRHATIDAVTMTQSLSQRSAEAGIGVVSGLAMGVDAAAHRGALRSKHPNATIAVLAHDVTKCFPSSSKDIYEQIVMEGGSVISEYPLGSDPMKHHFIARNRIIAALSHCTVITQAKEKSGALITAKYALELGRDVCVLPWSLSVQAGRGSNALLRDGAHPILQLPDLLAFYNK